MADKKKGGFVQELSYRIKNEREGTGKPSVEGKIMFSLQKFVNIIEKDSLDLKTFVFLLL